jgi:hypothetical protein
MVRVLPAPWFLDPINLEQLLFICFVWPADACGNGPRGRTVERIVLDESTEGISATKIRGLAAPPCLLQTGYRCLQLFSKSTQLQHSQEPCEWQTRWQMSSPSSRRPIPDSGLSRGYSRSHGVPLFWARQGPFADRTQRTLPIKNKTLLSHLGWRAVADCGTCYLALTGRTGECVHDRGNQTAGFLCRASIYAGISALISEPSRKH